MAPATVEATNSNVFERSFVICIPEQCRLGAAVKLQPLGSQR